MKKIIIYIISIILVAFIIFNTIGIYFFHKTLSFPYKPGLILSGSMEPTLKIDDLVIVKKTNNIKTGDIVLFYDENNKQVMHRVTSINGNTITTKGDANNKEDIPISKDKIQGKYIYRCLFLGKIIKFIKKPFAILLLIITIIIILLIPNKKNIEKIEKEKKNKIIPIVGYSTVLLTAITIGYYAKYISNVHNNAASRAAKWTVDCITTDNASDTLNLIAGDNTKNYVLKITSTSEVALNYSVIMSNIPSGIEAKIDNGTYQAPVNGTITYTNVGNFSANNLNVEHTHTITFRATLNPSIPATNNINIDVNYTQIN